MSQQGNFGEGGGGGVDVLTLTGNSGGPVPASAGGNINVVGTAPVNVTGNPGTNTLTISGAGSIPLTFTEDSGTATPALNNLNVKGTAAQGIVTSGATDTVTITASDATTTQKGVMALATDAEAIAGTVSDKAIVPTSLKEKLGVQTNKGIAYGTGTTTALGWTTGLIDGQLAIGSTAGVPAAATLTAGTNITITNAANSITISASTGAQVVTYTPITSISSPYTVLATDYYISADTTGGVISVLLPNAPTTGRIFVVKDKAGTSATNAITVTTVGGVVTIDGSATYTINTNREAISLIFNGTSYEVY